MPKRVPPIVPVCPDCKIPAVCVDSKAIYGKHTSYGPVWACPNRPAGCDCYIGCHPRSNRPLGPVLATREVRQARMRAHDAFDPMWRSGKMGRKKAYSWLARRLGIHVNDCHIGHFDVAMCNRVVEACEARNTTEACQ